MKVLQINKYFYEKGGSERTVFLLSRLLREHGIEVCEFSMQHPKNLPSKTSKFFISEFDYQTLSFSQKLRWIFRPFHSSEVRLRLRALLDEQQPDLAHLHNLSFHLTSSVIAELQARKIPFVVTLHDYALLGPNFTMRCRSGRCPHLKPGQRFQWQTVLHRCYDGSFLKSFIGATDAWWSRKRYLAAHTLISPSQFLADQFITFGWPKDRIDVLPHFIFPPSHRLNIERDIDVLFVGRLTEEKGVSVLVDAFPQRHPWRLALVGTGPLQQKVEAFALNTKSIQFLGYQSQAQLTSLYARAKIIALPSIWDENAPYVLLEAMSHGCVPIASRVGGIPEIVHDHQEGRLVEAGNSAELRQTIDQLLAAPGQLLQLRSACIDRMNELANPEKYFRRLINIYRDALPTKN